MALRKKFAVRAVALLITAFAGVLAATPAAAVGPGVFVIPAGATAHFTGATFGACNNLTWGYQLDLGPLQDQFTKPDGCFSLTAPDVTIAASPTPRTLRVYLRDNTCHVTYYSDGTATVPELPVPTPVDHAIVTPTGPQSFDLRLADAGGFCERRLVPLTTFLGYNFTVHLDIVPGPGCDFEGQSTANDQCEQH